MGQSVSRRPAAASTATSAPVSEHVNDIYTPRRSLLRRIFSFLPKLSLRSQPSPVSLPTQSEQTLRGKKRHWGLSRRHNISANVEGIVSEQMPALPEHDKDQVDHDVDQFDVMTHRVPDSHSDSQAPRSAKGKEKAKEISDIEDGNEEDNIPVPSSSTALPPSISQPSTANGSVGDNENKDCTDAHLHGVSLTQGPIGASGLSASRTDVLGTVATANPHTTEGGVPDNSHILGNDLNGEQPSPPPLDSFERLLVDLQTSLSVPSMQGQKGYTVQLLSFKKVVSPPNSTATTDKYLTILSDGVYFVLAMLATQLNELVSNGDIVKNSIVVIDRLTCSFIRGKRLIVIFNLHVVSRDEKKIGNPVALPDSSGSSANTAGETSEPSTSTLISSSRSHGSHSSNPSKHGRSIYPIEGLNPYQNNWTIKARVTQKSEIRTWSNQRGEGKFFNVTLMDETGEIRATGFNAVVDELYDKLEEGKVYYISMGRVNVADKKFSNAQNDYEMSLEKNTVIEECVDTVGLPMIRYNFVELASLENLAKDSTCDVLAIVKEVGPIGEVTSKTSNKSITKRDLTVVDQSLFSVRLTIWGRQAESFDADDFPVVAFKGVKVGDFGGRCLSMLSSSYMTISPDIEEAHLLRGWYDAMGAEKSFQSHSNVALSGGSSFGGFNRNEIRHLSDVKESQLGMSDKAEFFSTRATIMHIKGENITYPACPTQGCNKKVADVGDGWRCEKCEKTFERPEYRYVMSMAVSDWSSQIWLQGFNDAGLAVFGKTADEVVEMRERNELEYKALMAASAGKTFNFSCRAKQDTYNDQTRMRYGISKISGIEYYEEAKHLRDLLKQTDWAM